MSNHPISFDNTEIAFKALSHSELKKASRLFSLFNMEWLVSIGSSVTERLLHMGIPIHVLVKPIIYSHFCGGEDLTECTKLIRALATRNVGVLLNYGVEAKSSDAEYEFSVMQNMQAIELAGKEKNIKAVCIKLTGFGRLGLFEKLQQKQALTSAEEVELKSIHERFDRLCDAALVNQVALYIDAEESWIQDPIDEMTIERMRRVNKKTAIIFNTYQLYRNDKLKDLKADAAKAQSEGFILGAKMVRGAYVEKENEVAKAAGNVSPIHLNKAATDNDFNLALTFCLDHLDTISCCVASHNEHSCLLLTQLLQEKHIPFNHPHISVSQLYGMGDHITYNLSDSGINCTKYVPFGPVKEVIPYLIRRAQENGSVEGQMGREIKLLKKEINRRGI